MLIFLSCTKLTGAKNSMVLMETPICEFGQAANNFSLMNVDGKYYSLDDLKGEKATLIMFLSNHCPYVKAIQDELVEQTRKLLDLGVNSIAIMPNDTEKYPEDSFENMQHVAKELDYPFPYLIDTKQETARQYNAVCTPDFFGYNHELELQYRGRFNAVTPASRPDGDIRADLLMAMIEIAETGHGPAEQIPSMGCSIKWKP